MAGYAQEPGMQRIQPIEAKGRKAGARLSPRSLSQLTRQLIYDEFCACGDIDQVAKNHRVPVRTVDSILHWFHARRGPQPERGGYGAVLRRTA
jgi:hypothetical protein